MRAWQTLKLGGRLLLRLSHDVATRDLFRFSGRARQPLQFPYAILLTQEINPSPTFASKVFNLRLAGRRVAILVEEGALGARRPPGGRPALEVALGQTRLHAGLARGQRAHSAARRNLHLEASDALEGPGALATLGESVFASGCCCCCCAPIG